MWLDIKDLQAFYNSPLGLMANGIIGHHIREIWPDVRNLNILGLGYSTPYLNMFHHEASNVIAAMPASQGVALWPEIGPGRTILTDEAELPIDDLSIDRVILIHGVECSESIRPMMREIWRVLSNNGRLIIIAPNRRGLWARLERTPFGYGRPYSQSQLTKLLRGTLFTPLKTSAVLHMPPTRYRFLIQSSSVWEKFGRFFLDGLGIAIGGVIAIEAKKQVYAMTPNMNISQGRGYITVPNQ